MPLLDGREPDGEVLNTAAAGAAKPVVIVFEGVDGAGKTTQVALLEAALRARRVSVWATGVFRTGYGRDLRDWFMDADRMSRASFRTQLFLLGSAMNQVADEIATHQASVVLVDRFVYTTMAYHGGGLEIGIEAVEEVYGPIIRRFSPDLVVILDLPIHLITERRAPADRIEIKDAAFYERVRGAYTAMAMQLPSAVVVDGRASSAEVHARVSALLSERFGPRL